MAVAFPQGPNTLGTGGFMSIPAPAFLNASGTYTNAMFIARARNAESVGNGAIRMGARTISGTVTLLDDAATATGRSAEKYRPGGLMWGRAVQRRGTLTIGAAWRRLRRQHGHQRIQRHCDQHADDRIYQKTSCPTAPGKGNLNLTGRRFSPI